MNEQTILDQNVANTEENTMEQELTPSTAEGQTEVEQQNASANVQNPQETPKTYTQEQVNDFVRDRLNRTYKSYGVENKKQLDELVGKAQAYDVIKDRFGDLQVEYSKLQEELALHKGNVNPDRYDDVRTYFKGKGIDFSNDGLTEALKTHPEWLNQPKKEAPTTTIREIGNTPNQTVPESEEERAAKLFGLNKFITF